MSPSAEQPPPPKTVKAWTYTKGGLPQQVLKLTTDHPFPEFPPPDPKSKEEEWLLVRVRYTALNPGEVLIMNLLPTLFRATFSSSAGVPQVMGYDLTGEVVDISPASSSSDSPSEEGTRDESGKFEKGSKIIAFLPISFILSSKSGAFQEAIAIPSKYAVLLPPSPSGADPDPLKEAAGLLLTSCTALTQIRNANLQPGQKVLVYGASGGIGTMAVQLARVAVGPEGKVIGVCSTRNLKAVWELGCDEVVDYTNPSNIYTGPGSDSATTTTAGAGEDTSKKEPIEAFLIRTHGAQPEEDQRFDAIIDCYGSQTLFTHSSVYLKDDGIYSACGVHANGYGFAPILASGLKIMLNNIWPRAKWLGGTGRTWIAASMFDPGREMMEYLVGLFGQGKLRVLRDGDRIWGFEEMLGGYEVLVSGRARGKVVVKVTEGE